jgi:hypothetical protein
VSSNAALLVCVDPVGSQGYKLRKHIAKALQTRSVAIRSALNTYNTIANAMTPPHQILKWEEVVEYAFLADFDLLCDMHVDVSRSPWSSPAARHAMDLSFKMCWAWEEISRLDVEVHRLVTYIRDEDSYLRACEDQLKITSPALTHQIAIYWNTRGRFNARHLKCLRDISELPGFSGTLVPGLSAHTGLGESASVPDARIPTNMPTNHIPLHKPSSHVASDTQEDLEEEEEEEEEKEEEVAEEASRSLQDILLITDDFSRLGLLDNDEEE